MRSRGRLLTVVVSHLSDVQIRKLAYCKNIVVHECTNNSQKDLQLDSLACSAMYTKLELRSNRSTQFWPGTSRTVWNGGLITLKNHYVVLNQSFEALIKVQRERKSQCSIKQYILTINVRSTPVVQSRSHRPFQSIPRFREPHLHPRGGGRRGSYTSQALSSFVRNLLTYSLRGPPPFKLVVACSTIQGLTVSTHLHKIMAGIPLVH